MNPKDKVITIRDYQTFQSFMLKSNDKYKNLSRVDDEACLNMILNPEFFDNLSILK